MMVRSDLETVPGIGPNMAEHLRCLGVTQAADLRGQSPEALYERDSEPAEGHLDPCVLVAHRRVVYFASNEQHDPVLLKWWNWKNRTTT
jgi:Pathogenicity locus